MLWDLGFVKAGSLILEIPFVKIFMRGYCSLSGIYYTLYVNINFSIWLI